MSANEKQVGGSHYVSRSVQPWDAMASWMTVEAFSGFLQGNVIKYISRYKEKNGVQDLEKARHYLDKLIEIERQKEIEATASVKPSGVRHG